MDEGPRHAAVTPDDHGALLAMITWFLACTLILCAATRIGVRFSTRRVPDLDDYLIIAAAAFAVGSTIAISLAVSSGLGKRSTLLTSQNVVDIQKGIYVATLLYVLTIGISKLSITVFLARLACTTIHKTAVFLVGVLTLCWTIATTAAVLFECELPHPWEMFSTKCISMMPFWLSASIVDIVTDTAMILLPVHIVSHLQLQSRKKAVVMSIFALRTILIVVSVLRLVFLHRALHADLSFDSIPYGIATQCHSTLSVIIACSPALKPFMDNVRTGMLSASLAKHGPGTTFGQESYNMQAISKTSGQKISRSRSNRQSVGSAGLEEHISECGRLERAYSYLSNAEGRIVAQPATLPGHHHTHASVVAPKKPRTNSPPRPPPPPEELRPDLSMFKPGTQHSSVAFRSESARSEGSDMSEGSGKGIIKKTRQWDVRYDDFTLND